MTIRYSSLWLQMRLNFGQEGNQCEQQTRWWNSSQGSCYKKVKRTLVTWWLCFRLDGMTGQHTAVHGNGGERGYHRHGDECAKHDRNGTIEPAEHDRNGTIEPTE